MFRHIAGAICDGFDITDDEEKGSKTDFLKKLTKPAGSRLLGIDKKLITKIAQADADTVKKYEEQSIIKHQQKDDNHIFMDTPMSDGVAGVLMVAVSLAFLCICLMLLVKLLQTIFRGRIAIWFRRAINLEIPSVPGLANYILIVFAVGITILFQSSSVTTSTLTPLVGIGLVKIDKMFAFTIGANVGTCVTGILSALVSDKRKTGLTVAFSHVLFNLAGTIVWYPVPLMRAVPLAMAKMLGNIAADLPWFPIFYIIFTFGGLPVILLGLSAISPWLCVFVGVPFVISILSLVALIGMRENKPHLLPEALKKDPSWLINSLRVNKIPEDSMVGTRSSGSAASADLGKDNWHLAPAAWGVGWFVVLALLTVCFNAKWADMKYTSWDKRNHYGISGWSACSYAFDADMAWAPAIDETKCTFYTLQACGTDLLTDCKKNGFADSDGANSKYEKSWVGCREECTTLQWQKWCEDIACSGSEHATQCQNVTDTVRRPYTVQHMPAGTAWTKGEMCRSLDFVCTGVDGDINVAANLSVIGLAIAAIGLGLLVTYSLKLERSIYLFVSLGFWAVAWVFLLASWAAFASTLVKDASCKVEAESAQGIVIANGKFGDIVNGNGSYTYGFVIGCWICTSVVISLIGLRIYELRVSGVTEVKAENAAPQKAENETKVEVADAAPAAAVAGANEEDDAEYTI
jgi:hypothetical protein